jgi:hypothetical protein
LNISPTFKGSKLEYEFRARVNRLYRAKTDAGEITIGRQQGDEKSKEAEL